MNNDLRKALNTIAINAVREAQILKGRGHLPWVYDDFTRQEAITSLLDVVDLTNIDVNTEHYPLTSSVQPKNPAVEAAVSKLADVLNGVDEEPAPAKITHKKVA